MYIPRVEMLAHRYSYLRRSRVAMYEKIFIDNIFYLIYLLVGVIHAELIAQNFIYVTSQ